MVAIEIHVGPTAESHFSVYTLLVSSSVFSVSLISRGGSQHSSRSSRCQRLWVALDWPPPQNNLFPEAALHTTVSTAQTLTAVLGFVRRTDAIDSHLARKTIGHSCNRVSVLRSTCAATRGPRGRGGDEPLVGGNVDEIKLHQGFRRADDHETNLERCGGSGLTQEAEGGGREGKQVVPRVVSC